MANILNADNGAISGSAGIKLSSDTSGVLNIQTNGTTAISISSSQVVSFGATSSLGTVYFGDGSASAPSIGHAGDTNTGIYFPGADQVAITTAGTQRFYVGSTGDVGIGTGSPGKKLQLDGGNAYTAALRFSYGAGASTYYADWGYKSNGNKVYLTITDGGSAVDVLTANYDGNVGIGTASPGQKLDVLASPGASSFAGLRVSDSGSADVVGLYYTGSSYSYGGVGANQGWIYCNKGDLNITNDSTGIIKFTGTSGTERARFNATGAFVLAGGTTTANGIGITFPATQSASSNANTLDDYEEGTWTPTIIGQTTNPTVTYDIRVGYYTKIGRVVSISGIVLLSAYSGGSGTVYISGLPFTVANDSQNFPVGPIGQMSGFTSGYGNVDGQSFVVRGDAGTTNMSILESKTTGTYDWTVGNLSATFLARFSLVYNT